MIELKNWDQPKQKTKNQIKAEIQQLVFRMFSKGYVELAIVSLMLERIIIWNDGTANKNI
ncbi:MAG: hypothetical protein HC840_10525 [Leptolyngbyaceae cyanobacterium RM2_2_4]|nr:hypothetical protein [Leptolyngbyaceae cyanobacterium RM2_2_4]